MNSTNSYWLINVFQSHIRGLTRDIKFDHMGLRSDFLLDLYEVSISGLHKLGDWNSTSGLKFSREHIPSNSSSIEGSFRNKTFTVITALVSFQKKKRYINLGTNGYCAKVVLS